MGSEMCIRDRALSVRKGIEGIRYGKKSIGVDFVLEGSFGEQEVASPVAPDRAFGGPLDGESGAGAGRSAVALRANHGAGPTSLSGVDGSAMSADLMDQSLAAQRKRPHGGEPSGLLSPVRGFQNGGIPERSRIIVPLWFPNIAHNYWENYRLTGEFYVRSSKFSV